MSSRWVVAVLLPFVCTPSVGHCLIVRLSRSTQSMRSVTNAPMRMPEAKSMATPARMRRSVSFAAGAATMALMSSSE